MSQQINKRVVVVLGMHRSGTSAITRALSILGVGLGDELHPAGHDNPKGFWEDRSMLEINEQLLACQSSAYDRLDLAWEHFATSPIIDSLRHRATQLVSRKLEENDGVWGFKDPRTCRLLSFWMEIFQAVDCEASFVIALRNPASVVASISTRNKIPAEKTYFLWLLHMLPAVLQTNGARRVVVDFDMLLDAPYEQLGRIASALDFPLPSRDSPSVREFENDFLEAHLRHTRYSQVELLLDRRAPASTGNLYQLLSNIANDQQSLDEPQTTDVLYKLQADISAIAPVFDYVNLLEDTRDELWHTIGARDAQIANLNQAAAKLDEILHSKLWRYTKPLRFIHRNLVKRPGNILRRAISLSAREIWHQIPLSTHHKQRLDSLFRQLPFVVSWSNAKTSQNKVTYVPLLQGRPLQNKSARLICFYLPQFHAIPENDAWWGKGFTEWTNVKAAQPQFVGHYQPHIPGELDYYNLINSEVQRRQVELAKLYGIEGFCFYFYWFGGKRLLEAPIENYLDDISLDLPFCLCWANENWSRRWDGLDSEILIAQQHSHEDDLSFIRHVARYMRDPRYIRIDGKPLLLVYRPNLLPSAIETAQRWRNWCGDNGIGEIYLAYTQSFESVNPAQYGFDAAIEFPPNNSAPRNISSSVTPLVKEFACTVYDWREFVDRSEKYRQPDYPLFRGVCPSWDNTARRKNNSTVFLNSTPRQYQRWLENAINDTVNRFPDPDKRLVFLNAWNEWAEGAHLEPDARYGYAYLQATRDALSNTVDRKQGSILLVTHDCHPHGAQFLILETAKQFKSCGLKVFILALGGGRLLDDFCLVGSTLNMEKSTGRLLKKFLADTRTAGTSNAITSTVVCGHIVAQLKASGFQVLSLIHELPGVIHEMRQEANARIIAKLSDKIVFPANLVYERFSGIATTPPEKVIIRHQGVVRKNPYKYRREEAHQVICKKHHLPEDTQIVLSIAYLDMRKGADLFVEIAARVLDVRPKTVFIWIGHAEKKMAQKVNLRIRELGLQEKILLLGFERDPLVYYAAATVYSLTSREDPFPNVVLESVETGVPVVAFRDTSGAEEFILEHGGRLVSHLDTADFARSICSLLANPGEVRPNNDASLRKYAIDLLHYLDGFPRVSVVVPNYNYERYLNQRLDTIHNQTFPTYEIIILDDASIDNSLATIKKYVENAEGDAELITNESNSGSVFRQWAKGIAQAKGDLVWIAEADDLADTGFLQELVPAFSDQQLVLGYCQSKQINSSGKILKNDYLEYSLGASASCLTDYCRDGREEISESMCIKNVIPNVSAVLFRRQAVKEALAEAGEELFKLKVAGDWLVYLHVLMKGKVYHSKKPLNFHRRHNKSITNTLQNQHHLHEVFQMQKLAISMVTPPEEAIRLAKNYFIYLCDHFKMPRSGGEQSGNTPTI